MKFEIIARILHKFTFRGRTPLKGRSAKNTREQKRAKERKVGEMADNGGDTENRSHQKRSRDEEDDEDSQSRDGHIDVDGINQSILKMLTFVL